MFLLKKWSTRLILPMQKWGEQESKSERVLKSRCSMMEWLSNGFWNPSVPFPAFPNRGMPGLRRSVPAEDKKRGPKNPKLPPKIGLLRWIFCSSLSWGWAHFYKRLPRWHFLQHFRKFIGIRRGGRNTTYVWWNKGVREKIQNLFPLKSVSPRLGHGDLRSSKEQQTQV